MWTCSHTIEAWDNARENLYRKTDHPEFLIEAYAEIRTYEDMGEDAYNQCNHAEFSSIYSAYEHEARCDISEDNLVEFIFEWANNFNTCDNGGWNLYVCPDGCHTVSFD